MEVARNNAPRLRWVFPGERAYAGARRLKLAFCEGASPPDNSCSPSNKGTGADKSSDAVPKHLGEIFRSLAVADGFTYNPRTGEQPTDGWAVSVEKLREAVLTSTVEKPVLVKDLEGYWKNNRDFLGKEGNNFGGWVKDGTIVLDATIVIESQAEAERLARENDQDGIFNLRTKEFVSTR